MSSSWDEFFLALARVYASKSKDQSKQVGAIIVGPAKEQRSGGYNGLPRGVDDGPPDRWIRPGKMAWCEHAERNAIYNAARIGTPCEGCTLYVCGLPPCTDCARAIIQAGIIEVVHSSTYCVYRKPAQDDEYALGDPERCVCGVALDVHIPERWVENMATARLMLEEAGVAVRRPR